MDRKSLNKLIWLLIFSISMAFLESAVVVYLRKLYYPEGFGFPLEPIGKTIAGTEFFREVATVLMLLAAGGLAGRKAVVRFGYFIFCFGVWDIFYYVFLWVILGWPSSLTTPDILFLIPIPWVGPVIAPVIVSLSLILLTFVILAGQKKDQGFRILPKEWVLLIGGALVIILSFMWDYGQYVLDDHSFAALFSLSQEALFEVAGDYVPREFDWSIFLAGELICTLGVLHIVRRKGIFRKNKRP